MVNARKHQTPAGSDATVSRETIFETFGNSINDIVPVATVTERSQVVAALVDKGVGPTPARPLTVLRGDAPGLHRVEYTFDGSVWIPASGSLTFATVAARDAWTTANGSALQAGDVAVVGTSKATWTGQGWLPDVATAVFDFTIEQFTEGTPASSAITAVQNNALTTDTSFILSRTGTVVTVRRGVYLASIQFASAPAQTFTGRTFAEIAFEGGTGVRVSATPNVGENAVGAPMNGAILADGGAITGTVFKRTGATSAVSGRFVVTKLS